MKTPIIRRVVHLEPRDYGIVRRLALSRGLNERAFSAAVRTIIREWSYFDAARSIEDALPEMAERDFNIS